jgi:hypothetical protein
MQDLVTGPAETRGGWKTIRPETIWLDCPGPMPWPSGVTSIPPSVLYMLPGILKFYRHGLQVHIFFQLITSFFLICFFFRPLLSIFFRLSYADTEGADEFYMND